VESVYQLGAGLVEGLTAIHACGLVHRDLKPANVILASDGPRVIDFGIARALDVTSGTSSGLLLGTPAFMSPEQARGEAIGPASDVFSFGAVLTFAASGQNPFGHGALPAVVYRIVHERPDLDGVPEPLRDLIAACLTKDPAQRPALPELLDRLADHPGRNDWLPPPVRTMIIQRVASVGEVTPTPGATTHPRTPLPTPVLPGTQPSPHALTDVPAPVKPQSGISPPPQIGGPWLPPPSELLPSTGPGAVPRAPDRAPRLSRRGVLASAGVALLAAVAVPTGIALWPESKESTARPSAPATTAAPPDPTKVSLLATLNGHSQGVSSVVFSKDGKTLASGSGDRSVILWDVARHTQYRTIATGLSIECVAFSGDGRIFVGGGLGDGSDVVVWDIASGEQTGSLELNEHIYSVASSPDGKIVATGGGDNVVRFWDAATLAPIGLPLDANRFYVASVAFSPDGKTLAAGGSGIRNDDSALRLWDTSNHQQIGAPFGSNTKGATEVAFSPDGKTLATACWDNSIRLWDVATQTQIGSSFTGHEEVVTCVAFSPDGRTLASGGGNDVDGVRDPSVRLWDVRTRSQIGPPIVGHTKSVRSVAFSPDGRILASGGNDGTVRLWRLG
jgi:WD40 repeat protein